MLGRLDFTDDDGYQNFLVFAACLVHEHWISTRGSHEKNENKKMNTKIMCRDSSLSLQYFTMPYF